MKRIDLTTGLPLSTKQKIASICLLVSTPETIYFTCPQVGIPALLHALSKLHKNLSISFDDHQPENVDSEQRVLVFRICILCSLIVAVPSNQVKLESHNNSVVHQVVSLVQSWLGVFAIALLCVIYEGPHQMAVSCNGYVKVLPDLRSTTGRYSTSSHCSS